MLDAAMLSSGASADLAEGPGGTTASGTAAGAAGGRTLAAHRGFLTRARSIPIHQLYQEARARGKRLVLCGERCGEGKGGLCLVGRGEERREGQVGVLCGWMKKGAVHMKVPSGCIGMGLVLLALVLLALVLRALVLRALVLHGS